MFFDNLVFLHSYVPCFPSPQELRDHGDKGRQIRQLDMVAQALGGPRPFTKVLSMQDSLYFHLGQIEKRSRSTGGAHVRLLGLDNYQLSKAHHPDTPYLAQEYMHGLRTGGQIETGLVGGGVIVFMTLAVQQQEGPYWMVSDVSGVHSCTDLDAM